MGLLSNLFGGPAAGTVIKDAASGIGGLAKDIRTAITGVDPAQAAELEKLTAELESKAMEMQTEINKTEASSASLFIAGWRPALGWVCVISLAAVFWPKSILGAVFWVKTMIAAGGLTPAPDMGVGDILGLLVPLLGIGTMRTVEKLQGAQRNH